MDTSGFYKIDGDQLLHGPNTVMGADIELLRDEHTFYSYPVSGWYWFDGRAEALQFFGLAEETTEVPQE